MVIDKVIDLTAKFETFGTIMDSEMFGTLIALIFFKKLLSVEVACLFKV